MDFPSKSRPQMAISNVMVLAVLDAQFRATRAPSLLTLQALKQSLKHVNHGDFMAINCESC
jgi:hypothetical protein